MCTLLGLLKDLFSKTDFIKTVIGKIYIDCVGTDTLTLILTQYTIVRYIKKIIFCNIF